MIKLTVTSGKKNRIINGVRFVDGSAVIDDNLLPKAQLICKYNNVKMDIVMQETAANEDIDESDPNKSTVGPESVGAEESASPGNIDDF